MLDPKAPAYVRKVRGVNVRDDLPVEQDLPVATHEIV